MLRGILSLYLGLFLGTTLSFAVTGGGEGAPTPTLSKKPVVLGTGTMKSKLPSLSARRSSVDDWLIHRVHTKTQCTAAGGFLFNVGASGQICRFVAPSCPAAWTQYSASVGAPKYKATAAKTCTGVNLGGCSGTVDAPMVQSCPIAAKPLGPLVAADYTCSYGRKKPSTWATGGVFTGGAVAGGDED